MNKTTYLKINNIKIPTPDELEFEFNDIESSSGGITQAGIKQRDVLREGVVSITVKLTLTSKWLLKISELLKNRELEVKYFNPYTLTEKTISAYVTNYKINLLNKYGIWDVSFNLEEY